MQNRILVTILVAGIAVLVGVGIVGKQFRENSMGQLLKQQDLLLQAQARMEQKLTSPAGGALAQPDSALLQKVNDLENRLTSMENQMKGMLEGLDKFKANAPQMPPPEDLSKVYDIPINHSSVRGDKNAPVTIVEFVDFQCPFCARFHSPILEVLKAYPKDVKYILKNFPLSFHDQARPAAKAAFAAGEQGK